MKEREILFTSDTWRIAMNIDLYIYYQNRLIFSWTGEETVYCDFLNKTDWGIFKHFEN